MNSGYVSTDYPGIAGQQADPDRECPLRPGNPDPKPAPTTQV